MPAPAEPTLVDPAAIPRSREREWVGPLGHVVRAVVVVYALGDLLVPVGHQGPHHRQPRARPVVHRVLGRGRVLPADPVLHLPRVPAVARRGAPADGLGHRAGVQRAGRDRRHHRVVSRPGLSGGPARGRRGQRRIERPDLVTDHGGQAGAPRGGGRRPRPEPRQAGRDGRGDPPLVRRDPAVRRLRLVSRRRGRDRDLRPVHRRTGRRGGRPRRRRERHGQLAHEDATGALLLRVPHHQGRGVGALGHRDLRVGLLLRLPALGGAADPRRLGAPDVPRPRRDLRGRPVAHQPHPPEAPRGVPEHRGGGDDRADHAAPVPRAAAAVEEVLATRVALRDALLLAQEPDRGPAHLRVDPVPVLRAVRGAARLGRSRAARRQRRAVVLPDRHVRGRAAVRAVLRVPPQLRPLAPRHDLRRGLHDRARVPDLLGDREDPGQRVGHTRRDRRRFRSGGRPGAGVGCGGAAVRALRADPLAAWDELLPGQAPVVLADAR